MNKKLLTAAPPIQGGCSENSTKLQRGGKTSGLTCLDNCLSNSDIEFPLLSSQFKDLNLQLHAGTNVTNPYTFSIQGNKSFSASVKPAIPDTNTVLDSYIGVTEDVSLIVTIPAGVNVILVSCTASAYTHHTGEDYPADIAIGRSNDNGDIVKLYAESVGFANAYVKVTSGKTYKITMHAWTDYGSPDVEFNIYYSKTINNTTPTVIDL